MNLTQPIKIHGGKHYIAKKIVALMPPRCKNPNKPSPRDKGWLHYVEPYFGGGSVLLANDPEGISEVVNDIDRDLLTFWKILSNLKAFQEFKRRIEGTPFCEAAFDEAGFVPENPEPMLRAILFFVRCRQSRQGLRKDFATITRNRTRRGMNEQASSWLSAIEGLPDVHARMSRVVMLNRPAPDVIRNQDDRRTLFYLDPPYLHETRAVKNSYAHEMSKEDHEKLLLQIADIRGRFLLSGYRSKLYDDYARGYKWDRVEIPIDNKAGSGKTKRKMIEVVWANFKLDKAVIE